jgi:hypothetical protein
VNSKRNKAKRKERVQKDTQCSANRGGERERGKKKKKKRNEKIKKLEIIFFTLGMHRTHPPRYILYNLYGTI